MAAPTRPWTAWSAATSATARPRWPCAPPCEAVLDGKQVAVLAPDHRAGLPALEDLPRALRALPGHGRDGLALPLAEGDRSRSSPTSPPGKVDILIGTHRLLSKDVAFRDLGLLVIDEEQRFGVRHKEKLKQLRDHRRLPDPDRHPHPAHAADGRWPASATCR